MIPEKYGSFFESEARREGDFPYGSFLINIQEILRRNEEIPLLDQSDQSIEQHSDHAEDADAHQQPVEA